MMTITTGCATGTMGEMKVPGNPSTYDYATQFEFDWNVFESGTYSYGPDGSLERRLGGTRAGYQSFFDLTLNFRFKDGREYREEIDLRPLIRKMVKNHEIFDLMKTKWGGYTSLIIRIQRNRLAIEYEVREYKREENPKRFFSKAHLYPVFQKTLD